MTAAPATLADALRNVLASTPGLVFAEIYARVAHRAERHAVSAGLCTLRKNGYVVRGRDGRYALTGKSVDLRRRAYYSQRRAAVRERDAAQAAQAAELAQFIDYFLRRPAPPPIGE